ncbi:MAG: hypothetical protein AAFP78_02485, partial [Pseudomonadota bacterium]
MNELLKVASLCFALTIGAVSTATADEQREAAQENFLEADANADGALTIDEFTRMIDLNAEDGIGRSRMIQRTGRYAVAFGRIDANGDEIIAANSSASMIS